MVLYWSLLWPSAIAVASASRAVASRAVAPAVPFLIHRSAAVSPPPRLAGAVSKREVVLDDANLQGVTIYGAGSFETADELEAKLFEMGVDVASWGDGKAKTCKALFTELELGESVLRYTESDGVVLREVRVVKVRIQRPDAPNESLVEARQIFADGRERARGTPLSEKVLLWEGPVAAARRGVLEELGPALGPRASSILIDDASLTAWEETRQSSSSYPTLATRYLLHQVDALVAGLPSTAFSTLEKCALTAAAAAAAGYNARALRRRHRRLVASAALTPKRVLSASGRPLELPCDLRHVWEWWPIEECVAAAAQVRAAASVPPTVAAA